jgi:predicted MFS family arabinose efflux permease
MALLILAILSMIVFMIRGGQPVIAFQVVIFGVLFAISMAMLTWYMKCAKRPATGRSKTL